MKKVALIIGAGDAIGSAIVRKFAENDYIVCAARRSVHKLDPLILELSSAGYEAHALACDARREEEVTQLFAHIEKNIGEIDVTVFNIGANVPMTILDTETRKYSKIWEMACFAGFLAGREAARYMVKRQRGSIIFTGATASTRGAAGFGACASAKHGLKALAQSLAREMGPQNIHVAHVIIDAAVDTQWIRENLPDYKKRKENDGLVNPEELAENYVMLHEQPRTSWTFELDIRPWNERW